MGDARPGRRVVISGDTAPCKETAAASKGADLLVHDGSFAVEEADRAAETGHTTARDAAILARGAGSGCSPSSTCRPATTSPSCLPRRARSTRPRSRRATSTSSRSPFPSAAIRSSSTRAPSSAALTGRTTRTSKAARTSVAQARRSPRPTPAPGPPGGSASPGAGSGRRHRARAGRRGGGPHRARGPRRPTRSGREPAALGSEAFPQHPLLRLGELESAHDPQECPAAVIPLQQVVVGVDLGARNRRAVLHTLEIEKLRERKPGHRPQVPSPIPRIEKGRIDQGAGSSRRPETC